MSGLPTTVLKIGGSVITAKQENRFEIKKEALHRIAAEILAARQILPQRLILVHGAGPFGHTMVSRYGIANGLDVPAGIEGFVRTHNSMQDLNYVVMDVMRSAGLLGFPIQPSAVIEQEKRRILRFDTATIRGLLALDPGIVPILYGDMVLDRAQQGSVVSGDAIVSWLAADLGASRVLLGTDVDGIFTGDPKRDPQAQRVERIDRGNFESVRLAVRGATTVDVTGGMEKKLLELRDKLAGVQIRIFDAQPAGQVESALLGGAVGTEICF